MYIPLLAGRTFDHRDGRGGMPVVMVNEAFVKKFFEGREALGQHIVVDREDRTKERPLEVVGVVGNTRHDSLAIEPIPEFYIPFAQDPDRRMYLVLRTSSEKLTGLENSARGAIHEIDPDIYVPHLKPLEELIGITLAQPRFNMMLLGVFAGVAMTLAAIGIYGVIAYTVTQRTKEFGIRMALGAQRSDMLQMILRQSFSVVAIGLAIGLFAALALTRLMASLLYGVSAHDFSIYALVLFVLSVDARPDALNIETTPTPAPRHPFSDRSGTVEYTINVPQTARIARVELPHGELVIDGMRGAPIAANLGSGQLVTHNCFCDQNIHVNQGGLNVFFDWLEERPIAIEAMIKYGNALARVPTDATFQLHAVAPQGHVSSDFSPMETRKRGDVSEINEVIGDTPATKLSFRASEGNIHISEVIW